MRKLNVNGRAIKGILVLQQFDLRILDKPRKKNFVIYFLWRLTNTIDDEVVDDNFPDEHIFAMSIETPWFADIANYLATINFP